MLLGDEIGGKISIAPSTGTWQEQLIEMARRVRRGLLVHRDAARLLAVTAPFGPRRLRLIESLLRILRSAGLSARDAARAGQIFNIFVTEFVADEGRFAAFATAPGSSRRKMFAQVRKHFKSLPRAEYPVIVELAGHLAEDDADGLFEFGLQFWLRGLRSLSDGTGS